jgi:hypothetical protein
MDVRLGKIDSNSVRASRLAHLSNVLRCRSRELLTEIRVARRRVTRMSRSALLLRSLFLAGWCGLATGLLYADPETKPATEAQPAVPDSSEKPQEKAQERPEVKPRAKAQANSPVRNKNAAAKAAIKNVEITAEREQAALDFAGQHHPELVSLITPLKASNLKEYQRAIRELFRTSERLAGIRAKDPGRSELELEAWKLQSQIRLLAARLTMEADAELELQLRDALKQKAETQLKLLRYEREMLQTRLEQVQKQIDKSEQSQEQLVQQEYDRLLKKSSREKAAVRNGNPGKPAGKKPNAAKPPADSTNQ